MAKNVNWYGEKVKAEAREGARVSLFAIGLEIEAQAKVNVTENGQIDTGFMRNSLYTASADESHYQYVDNTGEYDSSKSGSEVWRSIAPELMPTKNDVYVVAGAAYAIYQEAANSFLFRALEQVAGSGGADIAIKQAAR